MKVLILTNKDDGLYQFRKDLILKLISMGIEIYVSVPYANAIGQLEELGCKCINTPFERRGMNPVKDIKLLRNYLSVIREVKPDKVITYTIKPNIYGGIACGIRNIPMYANVTGLGTAFQDDGALTKLVTIMYKTAFKNVQGVFFENTGNRDVLVKKGIIPKEKTHCLSGAGVNLKDFAFSEYPQDGDTRFLFIGRMMREKGINELFASCERLKKDGYSFALDVLGDFEESYEEHIKRLEDKRILHYHGYQSDVKPFIRKAHCFVLPSYHEGMANTLLECGAMGRPLITSNIHGCLEAVDDGGTGFLCSVRDADDLYVKMKKFIELPYERKKEMGRLSHEYVAERFDKRKVVDETIKAIFSN